MNSAGAGTSVYLCTDGQLHIRQVIHPEAASKVSEQAGWVNASQPGWMFTQCCMNLFGTLTATKGCVVTALHSWLNFILWEKLIFGRVTHANLSNCTRPCTYRTCAKHNAAHEILPHVLKCFTGRSHEDSFTYSDGLSKHQYDGNKMAAVDGAHVHILI